MMDQNVRTIYRYGSQTHDENEIRLMIKFAARNADAIEAYILKHHDYDVPEWIVIRPENVNSRYLAWATE
jgi:uncharacterized protein involved in tolerance to divalent cations